MIFILTLINTINFYVQPVLYYTPLTIRDSLGFESKVEDIFYLEFNCAIPYNELYYKEAAGKIFADCDLKIKLLNKERTDSLSDSLHHQFTIPSFSRAAKEGLIFYIQFGKYIAAGEYDYIITLTSGDNTGVIQGKKIVTDNDFLMSDLLLAKTIFRDTLGRALTKGNLKIIPQPSAIFEEGVENVFIYYELYNINPDTTNFTIRYMISDATGKTIRKITREVERKFPHQAINLGFDIRAFEPGDYFIRVLLCDSLSGKSTEKSVGFRIKKKREKIILSEDLLYYDAIEYFVSAQEYRYFLALDDKGRKMYLKKFWEKHNYNEIAQRYEYADEHFREGNKSGSKTDRGRIYIKYGTPDEIDNKQFESSNPYEYWQYYSGIEFIFVDVRGTQEYTLVWTNARDEKSRPTMYDYLPLFKLQELYENKE